MRIILLSGGYPTLESRALKTMGPQSAKLVAGLYDAGLEVFTVEDASRVLSASTHTVSNLLGKALGRGLVTRVRRGLYSLVPFELGSQTEYARNPYMVASRLMGDRPHYVSHGSALSLHGMTTQPQLVVFTTGVEPPRGRTVLGTEFRFIRARPQHMFGVTEVWATDQDRVPVSDIERTVVDCLRAPEHCGGYAEADKGAWMRRHEIDPRRLVDYALRLDVGAVTRRVGFLMESCGIGSPEHGGAPGPPLGHLPSLGSHPAP